MQAEQALKDKNTKPSYLIFRPICPPLTFQCPISQNSPYDLRNLENVSIDSPQFSVGAKQLKFYRDMYTSLEKQHTTLKMQLVSLRRYDKNALSRV